MRHKIHLFDNIYLQSNLLVTLVGILLLWLLRLIFDINVTSFCMDDGIILLYKKSVQKMTEKKPA